MAKIVVLGVGLQGQAVVHHLMTHTDHEVVGADLEVERVRARLNRNPTVRVQALELEALEVTDAEVLTRWLARHQPQLVICMVPPSLQLVAARAALEAGAHFVSSSYAGALHQLDEAAREKGLALLPEMGLDPGLDLLLCRLALDELDEVRALESYGGGLPAPAHADDTPLRYKVTWSFDGVLAAYLRPARLRRGGQDRSIPGHEMFHPDQIHLEQVPEVGPLEAYPNGDALGYLQAFGLGDEVQEMARYGVRYPGHCAFWYAAAQMGLLDEAPVEVDGALVSPRRLLSRVMEPRLRLGPDEQDMVVLRARARGRRRGREAEVVWDLIDWRDLDSGLCAMNRTVGFTAAVGAQLLLDGTIAERGLLSPARHVPPQVVFERLAPTGIQATRRPGADHSHEPSRHCSSDQQS